MDVLTEEEKHEKTADIIYYSRHPTLSCQKKICTRCSMKYCIKLSGHLFNIVISAGPEQMALLVFY